MQSITIPASYDVWLTGLKFYLARTPGSKAELARYLEKSMDIKFSTATVKVSRILAREFIPSAETFLDIAAWLQRQTEAQGNPPHFSPLPDPPKPQDESPPPTGVRRPVKYTTAKDHLSSRVAED